MVALYKHMVYVYGGVPFLVEILTVLALSGPTIVT